MGIKIFSSSFSIVMPNTNLRLRVVLEGYYQANPGVRFSLIWKYMGKNERLSEELHSDNDCHPQVIVTYLCLANQADCSQDIIVY